MPPSGPCASSATATSTGTRKACRAGRAPVSRLAEAEPVPMPEVADGGSLRTGRASMRRTAGLLAGVVGLLSVAGSAPAGAQTGMMQHVDLTSPKMSEAELSRDEVVALLEAATRGSASRSRRQGPERARPLRPRPQRRGSQPLPPQSRQSEGCGAQGRQARSRLADRGRPRGRRPARGQHDPGAADQGAACRRRSLGRARGRQFRGRESRGREADQCQHGARHEEPVDGPDAHGVPLGRARSRRPLRHRSRLGGHGVRQAAGQRAGRRRLQHGAPGRRRHDRRERSRDERRRRQPRLGQAPPADRRG